MQHTALRSAIANGTPSLGTRVLTMWPGIIEVVGQCPGYDYVEFAGEYAPYDLHDLDALARAAEIAGLGAMIKVDAEPRSFLAQRALAAGFDHVLFADIRDADDAREAVAAVRPEPEGTNGVRMDRRTGYVGGYASAAEVVERCEAAVVAVMIEKKEAVENLDAILAVNGIDMVQFGPADYALSLGQPGETDHEAVRAAERETIQTALDNGIEPRAEIRSPTAADSYIEAGVTHFSLNTDVRILHEWWSENSMEIQDRL